MQLPKRERMPARRKVCDKKRCIYKAEIKFDNNGTVKIYIGVTSNTFKERYRNHLKSFKHPQYIYSSETELSKYVWNLKNDGKKFGIKWSIVRRAQAYTPGANRCNLCMYRRKATNYKVKVGKPIEQTE